jgi:putative flippase GtrA
MKSFLKGFAALIIITLVYVACVLLSAYLWPHTDDITLHVRRVGGEPFILEMVVAQVTAFICGYTVRSVMNCFSVEIVNDLNRKEEHKDA